MIPKFETTQESFNYGDSIKHQPDKIAELRRHYERLRRHFFNRLAMKKFPADTMIKLAYRGQLLREAYERAEGKWND